MHNFLSYGITLIVRLSPSDVAERKIVWSKFASILSTYENLYLTDQVYLVEALEHVQFGQLTVAANVVQKLVRDVLESSHKLVLFELVRCIIVLFYCRLILSYMH